MDRYLPILVKAVIKIIWGERYLPQRTRTTFPGILSTFHQTRYVTCHTWIGFLEYISRNETSGMKFPQVKRHMYDGTYRDKIYRLRPVSPVLSSSTLFDSPAVLIRSTIWSKTRNVISLKAYNVYSSSSPVLTRKPFPLFLIVRAWPACDAWLRNYLGIIRKRLREIRKRGVGVHLSLLSRHANAITVSRFESVCRVYQIFHKRAINF